MYVCVCVVKQEHYPKALSTNNVRGTLRKQAYHPDDSSGMMYCCCLVIVLVLNGAHGCSSMLVEAMIHLKVAGDATTIGMDGFTLQYALPYNAANVGISLLTSH
jgi:hypothetical protein